MKPSQILFRYGAAASAHSHLVILLAIDAHMWRTKHTVLLFMNSQAGQAMFDSLGSWMDGGMSESMNKWMYLYEHTFTPNYVPV